jgi:hypothetical protein
MKIIKIISIILSFPDTQNLRYYFKSNPVS